MIVATNLNFTNMFFRSFYAQRSQKRWKAVKSSVSFYAFEIYFNIILLSNFMRAVPKVKKDLLLDHILVLLGSGLVKALV